MNDINDSDFPEEGLVRVNQIIGDAKRGIKPFVPVSKANWWAGVKSGRYPKSRSLSEAITVWDAREIRAYVDSICKSNKDEASN